MKKERILIVSGAFYPENSPRSYRTTELVKEYIRQGYDVTVCVNDKPGVSDFFKSNDCTWLNLGKRKWNAIGTSSNTLLNKCLAVLRRLLNLFFEYPDLELLFQVRKALMGQKNYDLLISIAVPYPIHWGVAFSFNKKNPIAKKWIADCGDPYMGDVMDTFRKLFYFKYLEKYFCRKCTFLSVPFENAKNGYYSEFQDKIVIIPQGFNFENIEIHKSEYIKNRIPHFCYAGLIFKGGRDPNKFIEYLNSLNIDFDFSIYTNNHHLIIDNVLKSRGKIKLYDFIEKNVLIGIQSKMDFNINFENVSNIQSPSKLIELSIIGRPILSINPNELKEYKVINYLNWQFEESANLPNINDYNINVICKKFLNS